MKILKSSFEGEMVQHYDQFFLTPEKVYQECAYIIKLLKACHSTVRFGTLLDVGCGTGAYSEEMSKYFEKVYGVDISKDMISYAKENHVKSNTSYYCSDIGSFDSIEDNSIDVAISLAHVIGYQLDLKSVDRYLSTINRLLKPGAFVFLNFYNMLAINGTSLQSRHVKKKNEYIEITRISNATNNPENSCLDLDYYYIFEDSRSNDGSQIVEIHEQMRYYSRLEIELLLNRNGFIVERFFGYNTERDLTSEQWNAGVIARKE